jgi:hypothetical protein
MHMLLKGFCNIILKLTGIPFIKKNATFVNLTRIIGMRRAKGSLNFSKMNVNAVNPDIVEPNFGWQNWMQDLVAVLDRDYS